MSNRSNMEKREYKCQADGTIVRQRIDKPKPKVCPTCKQDDLIESVKPS